MTADNSSPVDTTSWTDSLGNFADSVGTLAAGVTPIVQAITGSKKSTVAAQTTAANATATNKTLVYGGIGAAVLVVLVLIVALFKR